MSAVPAWLGEPEELAWCAAERSLGALAEHATAARGRVLVPVRPHDEARQSVRYEGNRSVVVPAIGADVGGRRSFLSVKGCGAAAPMYGTAPFRTGARGSRAITRERWMGEAPFGGQGEEGALAALAFSRQAPRGVLEGFHFAPTIEALVVPEARVEEALAFASHRGPVVQEHRLVPSDVRLTSPTGRSLFDTPDAALDALGVRSVDDLEAFLERFVGTALAALTLFARTMRRDDAGAWVGLDYDDVWLDKDAVLAPDGALVFVDLEALEWMPAHPSVEARVRRQVGRNAYEVLFACDVLLEARARLRGASTHAASKRAVLAALAEMAVGGDPWVRIERGESVALVVRTPVGEQRVRWLDGLSGPRGEGR